MANYCKNTVYIQAIKLGFICYYKTMEERQKKIEDRLNEIEVLMTDGNFWSDKVIADEILKEYQDLKKSAAEYQKYDGGDSVINIFAGAGGDDAEDWVRMLMEMYYKFSKAKNYETILLNENITNSGYRNVSFEVKGRGSYGALKNESGVHRLVRLSPFNAKHTRETSFAMVEVVPILSKENNQNSIPSNELNIEFTKSSGPGGQNVNKRETAVRITHIPTGLTTVVSTERSQEQNRQIALDVISGKLFKLKEMGENEVLDAMRVSKIIENEWGNQIRNYVLHPYKMVKDLRSGIESGNPDAVLAGEIDLFLNK